MGLFFCVCAIVASFYSMNWTVVVLALAIWVLCAQAGRESETFDCLNGMIEQLRERITDLESEIESMKSG